MTELRRSFNSPKRDAIRGNPQPQKCTYGSGQNLYFMEGIIESVRREWVEFFFFFWKLVGEDYGKEWLVPPSAAARKRYRRTQSHVDRIQLQRFVHLFVVLMWVWELGNETWRYVQFLNFKLLYKLCNKSTVMRRQQKWHLMKLPRWYGGESYANRVGRLENIRLCPGAWNRIATEDCLVFSDGAYRTRNSYKFKCLVFCS